MPAGIAADDRHVAIVGRDHTARFGNWSHSPRSADGQGHLSVAGSAGRMVITPDGKSVIAISD